MLANNSDSMYALPGSRQDYVYCQCPPCTISTQFVLNFAEAKDTMRNNVVSSEMIWLSYKRTYSDGHTGIEVRRPHSGPLPNPNPEHI